MPWQSTGYLHLKAAAGEGARSDDGRFIVLYSLQWATEVPADVAAAVGKFAEARWIFRMHPFDKAPRDDLAWIRTHANAEITGAEIPLATAIAGSDLHITMNSSVVHEAAALGVRSLFLDSGFAVRFDKEMAKGLAAYAGDGKLLTLLDEIVGQRVSASRR
jgi:hypothetical protein